MEGASIFVPKQLTIKPSAIVLRGSSLTPKNPEDVSVSKQNNGPVVKRLKKELRQYENI